MIAVGDVNTHAYDSANRLVTVNDPSSTVHLSYNGLNQRLSMDAAGVIAHYVMDGDQPLTAQSNSDTTYYLYGLGAIAEKTTAWSYSLPDGTNTPRQLTDLSAEITLSTRYTPWGDTLELHGSGSFTYGYFGGVLDAAAGLLYVGNGQYYDPATGRFLTRDAKPNNGNPYVPWDPTGAIIAPLGIVALFFGRKKKGSKLGTFLVLLIVVGSVGMTLTGCDFTAQQLGLTPTSAPIPVTATATQTNGVINYTAVAGTQQVSGTIIAPTATPILPENCDQYFDIITIPSGRLVAARIFYEGASTFWKGSNTVEYPAEELFIKMVYAVKSLYVKQGGGQGYEEFTKYHTDPNGRKLLSIADPKGAYPELQDEDHFKNSGLNTSLPNWAVTFTNAILSDTPCPFAPANPFQAHLAEYADGIHWLSPTQFPRKDIGDLLAMPGVTGCENGNRCQVNDIRERSNWEIKSVDRTEDKLYPIKWEYALTQIRAPHDAQGNTDCYWRGVYFFTDTNFASALNPIQ